MAPDEFGPWGSLSMDSMETGPWASRDLAIFIIYTKNIDSDAYITGIHKDINSNAYILATNQSQINSDALIKFLAFESTLNSGAYILQTYLGTINSDAWLLIGGSESIFSNTYIMKLGEIQTIDSDVYIKASYTQTIESDAWLNTEEIGSINSDASILQTYSLIIDSDAYVKVLGNVYTIDSDAYILLETISGISSNTWVTSVSKVILVSPPDTSTDTTDPPIFVWEIPEAYKYSGRIDCNIQIAIDSGFNNILIDACTIVDSGFEYDNTGGGSWVTYPPDGVASTYVGNQARYTAVTLTPGTHYWRVRGCVR